MAFVATYRGISAATNVAIAVAVHVAVSTNVRAIVTEACLLHQKQHARLRRPFAPIRA